MQELLGHSLVVWALASHTRGPKFNIPRRQLCHILLILYLLLILPHTTQYNVRTCWGTWGGISRTWGESTSSNSPKCPLSSRPISTSLRDRQLSTLLECGTEPMKPESSVTMDWIGKLTSTSTVVLSSGIEWSESGATGLYSGAPIVHSKTENHYKVIFKFSFSLIMLQIRFHLVFWLPNKSKKVISATTFSFRWF